MPARFIQNSGGSSGNSRNKQMRAPKVQIKAPLINTKKAETKMTVSEEEIQNIKNLTTGDRAQFYAGHDRSNLRGNNVKRVRELQEENDHLQREISSKETELTECSDPLITLADIEHRKIQIARNTGEILKIYLNNEERIKRIQQLQSNNNRIQNEMMNMQGQFISTKDMEEKTKFASEFFLLKSEIEHNLQEINELGTN